MATWEKERREGEVQKERAKKGHWPYQQDIALSFYKRSGKSGSNKCVTSAAFIILQKLINIERQPETIEKALEENRPVMRLFPRATQDEIDDFTGELSGGHKACFLRFSTEGYRRVNIKRIIYDYIVQAWFWIDNQKQFYYNRQLSS
jgi:hypothetical protein